MSPGASVAVGKCLGGKCRAVLQSPFECSKMTKTMKKWKNLKPEKSGFLGSNKTGV